MKKIYLIVPLILSIFVFTNYKFETPDRQVDQEIRLIHPLDNMPIIKGIPSVIQNVGLPIEQRDIKFRKWLSPSVKIAVDKGSGSGTIIYYDSSTNTAYVATCGHLWPEGVMNAEQGKKRNLKCKIITWYQNEKKLDKVKVYNANVLFYSYLPGADTALVTFQPDWVPTYFPIASTSYQYVKGSNLHSLGCDGGGEVAHYNVEVLGIVGNSLLTQNNSPRPGRSGGGLMDDEYYVATCWGTEGEVDRQGNFTPAANGKGFFTPLTVIHRVWTSNGYEFLLKIPSGGSLAKQIPIRDRNNPQKEYEKSYVLVPGLS